MEEFEITLEPDEIVDITEKINKIVDKHNIEEGNCLVFAIGSTCAIFTTEYEEGHLKDLKESLEIIAPSNKRYKHHEKWGDDNGKSHVRAVFLQQDINIPVKNNRLILGTWQRICIMNLDTRVRKRKVVVMVGAFK